MLLGGQVGDESWKGFEEGVRETLKCLKEIINRSFMALWETVSDGLKDMRKILLEAGGKATLVV